jgi:hypothetical protein
MNTNERKTYQQIHQHWEKAEQTRQVMQERRQMYEKMQHYNHQKTTIRQQKRKRNEH